MSAKQRVIAAAIALAKEGVDYSKETGALCPLCKKRMAATTTRKAKGGLRTRYHQCGSSDCLLHALKERVKSIEAV